MNILQYNTESSRYFSLLILFLYASYAAIHGNSRVIGVIFLTSSILYQFIKSYVFIMFLSILLAEIISTIFSRETFETKTQPQLNNEINEMKGGYETKLDEKEDMIAKQKGTIRRKNSEINSLGKNIRFLQNERNSNSSKIAKKNRKIRKLRRIKRRLEEKRKRIVGMTQI